MRKIKSIISKKTGRHLFITPFDLVHVLWNRTLRWGFMCQRPVKELFPRGTCAGKENEGKKSSKDVLTGNIPTLAWATKTYQCLINVQILPQNWCQPDEGPGLSYSDSSQSLTVAALGAHNCRDSSSRSQGQPYRLTNEDSLKQKQVGTEVSPRWSKISQANWWSTSIF